MKKVLLMTAAVMLSACGGGDSADAVTSDDRQESTTVETSDPAAIDEDDGPGEMIELQLRAVGETMVDMKFEPTQLKVPSGVEVAVILDNTAEAMAMIHNFVLIPRGKSEEIYPLAMEAGADKNYVPDHPDIIAASTLAQPGERVKVIFTAPDPGIYQYICTYPGHMNMKGIFVVE